MTYKILSRFMVVFSGITLLLSGMIPPTVAEEMVFHQTQDEMIRELTRKPVKYRSAKPAGRTRSFKILEENQGNTGYHTTTITVTNNQDTPRLKLKIEFDSNSAKLRQSSYPLLGELGNALTSSALAGQPMLVVGHTDSDGTNEYNLRLSLDRANAVKAYLVSNFNIADNLLKVRGFGENIPLKPNLNQMFKQMNRRVEIQPANDN